MITTDNWAEEYKIKSLHGLSKDAWKRYSVEGYQPYDTIWPGYKYNMMDIQASLGIHQLMRLEERLKIRELYWQIYDDAFQGLAEIMLPSPALPAGSRYARHLYTILLETEYLRISRNEMIRALKAENIGTGIHFWPIHLHHFYRQVLRHKTGSFPNAEWIGQRTISLPLSPFLSKRDISDVIVAVQRIVEYYRA